MLNKEDIKTQQKIAEIATNNIKLDEKLIYKGENLISEITTGDIVIKLNENNKSKLEIGNIKIYNIKRFSWIQRNMFKMFFGIKISN